MGAATIARPIEHAEFIREDAKEILGWLIILAVDREQIFASKKAFDPRQKQLQMVLPLNLPTGIEVFVASLGERAARFKDTGAGKSSYRVVGQDSFMADELEDGTDPKDRLNEFGRRIWVSVMKEQAPIEFGPHYFRTLNAELSGRERRDGRHYYITVPPAPPHGDFALKDPAFLSALFRELPALRVLYLGDEQGGNLQLLREDEYELQSSVQAFHHLMREIS